MDKRLGVVGLGRWGSIWSRVLDDLGVLAWGCDKDDQALEDFAENHQDVTFGNNIASATHFQTDGVQTDGVVVATPPETHKDVVIPFLRAGIPVLVEKPMATSEAEAEEMIKFAKAYETSLMVGHTFYYHPAVALAYILANNYIGSPDSMYLEWAQDGVRSGKDTDVVSNLAPHPLSLVYGMMPEPMEPEIYQTPDEVVDGVTFSLKSSDRDFTAVVRVSHSSTVKIRFMAIKGKNGEVTCIPAENKVKWYPVGKARPQQQTVSISGGEPLKEEALSFMNEVIDGESLRIPHDGLWVTRIMEKVQNLVY